jgi:hypothetical protein
LKENLSMSRIAGVNAKWAVVTLAALAPTLALLMAPGPRPAPGAEPPAEKPYQIRQRTEAFVAVHALAPDPKDDETQALRKVRLEAALGEMLGRTREFLRDESLVDGVLDAGLRVLDAELDYYPRPQDRVRVLEKHLEIGQELSEIVEARSKAELASAAHRHYARYCRATVELALRKARREAPR